MALACVAAAGTAVADQLEFEIPEDYFEVATTEIGPITLRDYRPIGQSVTEWVQGITVFEWHEADIGAPAFAARLSADLAAGCDQPFGISPEVTEVDGLTSTLSLNACPNLDVSGRSEVTALRVIEGPDGTLFAVQRAWVIRPPREELDEWMTWLKALRVCPDTGCD